MDKCPPILDHCSWRAMSSGRNVCCHGRRTLEEQNRQCTVQRFSKKTTKNCLFLVRTGPYFLKIRCQDAQEEARTPQPADG
jgi:hypothetical protein